MKLWWLAPVVLLSGCATWPLGPHQAPVEESSVTEPAQAAAVADNAPEDALWPTRSVDELMVTRLELCQNVDHAAALAWQPPESTDLEVQLDALLLASCRPAATPGLLSKLIAELTKAGTWPKEYAGFFDLLLANQKAYALVEKLYTDLKTEHEETIKSLGEIEADIELHK